MGIKNINRLYDAISISWAYLIDSDEWMDALRFVLSGNVHVLVVNIGSNELCQIIRETPKDSSRDLQKVDALVEYLIHAAIGWKSRGQAKVTVFVTIIKRTDLVMVCHIPARFHKIFGGHCADAHTKKKQGQNLFDQ